MAFHWSGWTKVASFATAFTAIAALWFTSQSLSSTNDQYRLTEQGQITDRFGKAIEQVGSDKPDVRLGGIYSLERLAHDSPVDHSTIFEVLSAFIRTHIQPQERCQTEEFSTPALPVDVQAALTVIGRRRSANDGPNEIDLSMACLPGASLGKANLQRVNLSRSNLTVANLNDVNLQGTNLERATLVRASLTGANLRGAHLNETNLGHATLDRANLVGAVTNFMTDLGWSDLKYADMTDLSLVGVWMSNAQLTGARLVRADLSYAILGDARLDGADLSYADLSNAYLANAKLGPRYSGAETNLSGANLRCAELEGADFDGVNLSGVRFTAPGRDSESNGVYYDSKTIWPKGFTPPPSLPRPCSRE